MKRNLYDIGVLTPVRWLLQRAFKFEPPFGPGSELKRAPPPKNWTKNKCVLKWLLCKIQSFRPILFSLGLGQTKALAQSRTLNLVWDPPPPPPPETFGKFKVFSSWTLQTLGLFQHIIISGLLLTIFLNIFDYCVSFCTILDNFGPFWLFSYCLVKTLAIHFSNIECPGISKIWVHNS